MDSLKSKWNMGGDYQYYLHFFFLLSAKKPKTKTWTYMERFSVHQVVMAECQITNICWIMEKQGISINTSTSVSLTRLKPLTVWITTSYIIFLSV